MLAVTITCLNFKIQIIHFCGGGIALGSLDNIYRYCISKIARKHFVETQNGKNLKKKYKKNTSLKSIKIINKILKND